MAWAARNEFHTGPYHILRMKEHQLDLALEAEPFDLRLRCRLEGLRQCIAKLLERVKVTCPIGVCHQKQRSRVSRMVLEPLDFLPEPAPKRWYTLLATLAL